MEKTVIKIKNSVGRVNVRVGTAKRNINKLESEMRELAIKIITITIKRPTPTSCVLCARHGNCFVGKFFNPYRYFLRKAAQDPGVGIVDVIVFT